jgi:hypothetical protein
MHSTQQLIRELCQKLLDAPENSLDFYALADDLRAAIHEHIEDLRVLSHTLPISPKDLS